MNLRDLISIIVIIIIGILIIGIISGLNDINNPDSISITSYEDVIYSGDTIYGLSDSGKQKKEVVIPSEINGVKITRLGKDYMGCSNFGMGRFESANMETMFITQDLDSTINGMLQKCSVLKKIIYIQTNSHSYINTKYDFFNNATYYYNYSPKSQITITVSNGVDYRGSIADVQYNYNYNESPNNGVYWLDDYDNEAISYIPINPEREGFIFLGWYTDAECTNEWDFSSDRIPKKIYELIDDDDNDDAYTYYNYYYNKTELYAKWLSRR